MKIKKLTEEQPGCRRFDINTGGFTIKNCRWRVSSGQICFPQRHDRQGGKHRVVFAHGTVVNQIRGLLQSGECETPRDRRPCTFNIHFLGLSRGTWPPWTIFKFTVRGFTILGCRWERTSGSIQLPVTFFFDSGASMFRKKRVVCAYGAHIDRLRRALEAKFAAHPLGTVPVSEEVAVG